MRLLFPVLYMKHRGWYLHQVLLSFRSMNCCQFFLYSMSACGDWFLLHAKQNFLWMPSERWGALIWLVVLNASLIFSLLTCWVVTCLNIGSITHLHSHRVLTFTNFWKFLFVLLHSLWHSGLLTPAALIYSNSQFNLSMKKSIGIFLAPSFLQVWHSYPLCFLLFPMNANENSDSFSQSEYPQLDGLSYLECCIVRQLLLIDSYIVLHNYLPYLTREAPI